MVQDLDDSALAHNVRAGVYQRVSRLATAQDRKEIERARSIEEQNKANQDDCDRNGWTITDRYEDPGLSASRFATKDRPDYRRLLADIGVGKLDVVVLWESSRGNRELAGWAQFLTRAGRVGPRSTSRRTVGCMTWRMAGTGGAWRKTAWTLGTSRRRPRCVRGGRSPQKCGRESHSKTTLTEPARPRRWQRPEAWTRVAKDSWRLTLQRHLWRGGL